MPARRPLLAAAVGATATLAASVVTQLVAAARERHRLLDERRRAVVLDAQDVIQAVELWLDAAQETFLSPREGRPAQEERRWVNLQTRVRATLGLEPVR